MARQNIRMSNFAKAMACGIILFNLTGVILGYGGIYKLKSLDLPPFDEVNEDGEYFAEEAPDWILLMWDSTAGSLAIWFGCIVLPVILLILIFVKEKPIIGWSGLIISTIWLGIFGCWIFIYAVINFP